MIRYFFTIFLFINFIYAKPLELVLNNNTQNYNNFEISYIKDSTNTLTIQDVATLNSFIKHKSNFTFGYIFDTLWIKIDIKNLSKNEDFILSINEQFYEKANIYYEKDSIWQRVANGIFVPLEQRDVKSTKLGFNLHISEDSSQTIYLELKGKYPYFGNITIFTKEYFLKDSFFSINNFIIFVLGVLVIVVIYNLFLYISLKEKVFIYYVCYTFFAINYLINQSSFLVFFDLQHYIYKLNFSTSLVAIFLILFSIEYFEAKEYIKIRLKILQILIVVIGIFTLLMFYSYTPWNMFINNTFMIIVIVLISSSISIYNKGQKFLKYYILALSIYFISIIIFVLLLTGVVENNYFTRYAFIYALPLEIISFALILANRYNIIKQEQIKTQKELISLQQNQNKILEKEIEKKTVNLKNLLKEREVLLKEIFHRVKNNFHIVNAFLYFESKKDKDKNRFSELINRIKSMSLIHEYLCESKSLININIKEYVDKLTYTILQTYNLPNLKIDTNIEKIDIEFENMMSLGIIINEIVSNSIKHHPKNRDIVLSISCFEKDKNIVLLIKDNGLGFDFDKNSVGFGLELIKDFVEKLPNAKFDFYKKDGAVFKLLFGKKEEN